MKSVRVQLRGRFMKLFRMFRHKKYGEPLEEPVAEIKDEDADEPDEEEETKGA